MMTKTIVLSIIGVIAVGGFCCFVLFLAVLLSIDDAPVTNAKAGKVVINLRHEFFWSANEGTVFKKQCIEHTVGICASPVKINSSNRAASDSSCEMQRTTPQPVKDRSKMSESYKYEFEIEPDKTYYWFAHVRKDFDCNDIPPPEKLGFKTGEIKIADGETMNLEADFTK